MGEKAKRALVTGGGRGIGRAICETLAGEGHDVAILEKDEREARTVIDRIESKGRRGWLGIGDVRNVLQVHRVVEEVAGLWGGIDVLVNNAGIVRDQVIWKMTDEEWRDVIDVDLSGVFYCCRAVAPLMRKQPWGAIVNLSSINGMRGKFGQTNYSAAKAGVIGLTKALAREMARFNVTVNAVAPGFIVTPLTESMPDEAREQSLREVLLGRPGDVQEVADAVAFLCSTRARFITGQVLHVDGGQYL